jgi:3-phenylpropionate/cinnamic acid dioxygenase small subunit
LTTIDRNTVDTINELGVRYARYVDRREFDKLPEVFSANASIAVYPGEPATHQPLYKMNSLAEIQGAFQLLHRYDKTFHFVGQQLITEAGADSASGETYCMAYHFHTKQGREHCYVMYIRYQDRFAKVADQWRIVERQLILDRTTGEDIDQ